MNIKNNIVATEHYVDEQLFKNQSDWNQSDSSQKNFIKNRTHYAEYYDIREILPETTYTLTSSNDDYEQFPIGSLSIDDNTGCPVRVYFDGVAYNYPYGRELWDLGNSSIIYPTAENTGEPFYISGGSYGHMYCYILSSDIKIHNISIYEISAEYHKLDEEYLPDVAVTCHKAEVGQIIAVKSINEDGIPVEWEAVDGQTN